MKNIVVALQYFILNIKWVVLDIEKKPKIKDHFAEHSIRNKVMYKDHIL